MLPQRRALSVVRAAARVGVLRGEPGGAGHRGKEGTMFPGCSGQRGRQFLPQVASPVSLDLRPQVLRHDPGLGEESGLRGARRETRGRWGRCWEVRSGCWGARRGVGRGPLDAHVTRPRSFGTSTRVAAGAGQGHVRGGVRWSRSAHSSASPSRKILSGTGLGRRGPGRQGTSGRVTWAGPEVERLLWARL